MAHDSLTPGDFVEILRQSISEIYPLPKKRRVVLLLPKYLENSVNSVQLSSQALCYVANSTSVDIHCKFKQRADEEECEEDLPLQPEEEMCDSLPVFSSPSTSPDSMESVGFFTSACSSPSAVCSEAPSAQEPILLKQNSSAVSEEEESHVPDEDKTPSDMISGCPDLTLTLEGATEALSINSLSRESVEKIFPSVVSGDTSHSSEGDAVETTHAERRLLSTLNLHPNCYSNEDNQSVCSVPEIPAESRNFLSPNHEKFTYYKTVEDAVSIKPKNLTEPEEWIISPREPKTEFVFLQDSEVSGTSIFLELKPLRHAFSPSRVEECQEDFCCDSEDAIDQPEILTSRALTDTMHDLLAHLQHADDREPYQACSLSALKSSIVEMDLSLIHLSQRSRQLQHPIGSHSSPVHSQQLSVSQQARHRSSSESRVTSTRDAVCFRTTSDRVGHCKLGSWWKQALETRRASTGLLPALEQVSPVTRASSTEKRTSPVPRRPQTHGLGSFLDPPPNPRVEKREVKQAVKSEATGRRGALKVTINQMDHGLRGRRAKMSKRIK